jgi:biopolymer transport protein ExbD
MKKIVVTLLVLMLFSCGKKEIQLPQLNETVVVDVKDHSPIYMFFKMDGNDTLIDVNRTNSISSTNWLFNIDKRLPLKLVVPEIQKLQAKKEKSSHKKEGSENYFTYMDKKKKELAFLPHVAVEYKLEKPSVPNFLYFTANGKAFFNSKEIQKSELEKHFNNLSVEKETEIFIGYDENMNFENYLQNRILAKKINITKLGLTIDYTKEFVY